MVNVRGRCAAGEGPDAVTLHCGRKETVSERETGMTQPNIDMVAYRGMFVTSGTTGLEFCEQICEMDQFNTYRR